MTIDELKQRAKDANISVMALMDRARVSKRSWTAWKNDGLPLTTAAMSRIEQELAARTGGGK